MTGRLKSLEELGLEHNTDKAVKYTRPSGEVRHGNNYLGYYQEVLGPLRHEQITFMELGVGIETNSGRSLKLWDSFFTNRDTKIVGVDIGSYAVRHAGGRVSIEIGDCGSETFLYSLAKKFKIDVILDDASHRWAHQILSFQCLFPALNPGGLFIMEDIHTSFGTIRADYGSAGEMDAFQYLLSYGAALVGRSQDSPVLDSLPPQPALDPSLLEQIDYMSFIPRAVIIKKRASTR